jgi:hypothetical protein
VSKEEVAVGRKGSGGAWGSKKKSNIRSLGCRLQSGGASGAENGLLSVGLKKIKHHFQPRPYEQFKALSALV